MRLSQRQGLSGGLALLACAAFALQSVAGDVATSDDRVGAQVVRFSPAGDHEIRRSIAGGLAHEKADGSTGPRRAPRTGTTLVRAIGLVSPSRSPRSASTTTSRCTAAGVGTGSRAPSTTG